tara:strand:+ start:154 stop:456 length:303 start_codon:yes stop_codon:yes gene_type:complete
MDKQPSVRIRKVDKVETMGVRSQKLRSRLELSRQKRMLRQGTRRKNCYRKSRIFAPPLRRKRRALTIVAVEGIVGKRVSDDPISPDTPTSRVRRHSLRND